jgi:glycosyltransferase involved in cell wall biosynthesis
MAQRTIYFVLPGYRPSGGVLKVLDYVSHARSLGERCVVCAREASTHDLAAAGPVRYADLGEIVDSVPGLESLADVESRRDFRVRLQKEDIVFFSWPTQWAGIAKRLPDGFPLANVIHFVQNTRHGNPEWLNGYATRLLRRPLTRIVINELTLAAIEPHVNQASRTEVIVNGHRCSFFARERQGPLDRPLRVAYTTWKSDLGDRVSAALADDERFSFQALGGRARWSNLRDLYHSSDVFLCCPSPQEGFYLPALEAMAAGLIVLVPDVEGNMEFCRFEENCLEVAFEDVDSAVAALKRVSAMPVAELDRLRSAGHTTTEGYQLDEERQKFADLLAELPSLEGSRVRQGVATRLSHLLTPDLGTPGFRLAERAICGPRLAPLHLGRVFAALG